MTITTDPGFIQAVQTAHYHQQMPGRQPEAYIIHYIPEWGTNGAHFDPGFRVFKSAPQAGGLLPPSNDRPGYPVATVAADGTVTHLAEAPHAQVSQNPGRG